MVKKKTGKPENIRSCDQGTPDQISANQSDR